MVFDLATVSMLLDDVDWQMKMKENMAIMTVIDWLTLKKMVD
jgi:hypothetical protein